MTIVEFIDIEDREHLIALHCLFSEGAWDEKFYEQYLTDLEFPPNWQAILAFEMAERYIEEKLFYINNE